MVGFLVLPSVMLKVEQSKQRYYLQSVTFKKHFRQFFHNYKLQSTKLLVRFVFSIQRVYFNFLKYIRYCLWEWTEVRVMSFTNLHYQQTAFKWWGILTVLPCCISHGKQGSCSMIANLYWNQAKPGRLNANIKIHQHPVYELLEIAGVLQSFPLLFSFTLKQP